MVPLFILMSMWLVVFLVGLVLKPSVYKVRFMLLVINLTFLLCVVYFLFG